MLNNVLFNKLNKNIKKQNLNLFFIASFLLTGCFFCGTVFASTSPVILFSDITDGPTSGWEGSGTKGAAVSIWGNNLGTERGSSYITVGGVNLVSDSDYAEWGVTTTPTVPVGMQRITFYLKSTMTVGGAYPNSTISVTTSEGTSATIPFHTRELGTNKIYFIDIVNGDDSLNDGFYFADNGTNGPKKTTGWARENLSAGDIAYVIDSGVAYSNANSHDNDTDFYIYCSGGLLSFCDSTGGSGTSNHANGIEGKSIGLIAYPGQSPQMTPLDTSGGAFSFVRTVWEELEGWTFAKFSVNGLRPVDNKEDVAPPYSGHMAHIRFIGNDWTTPAVTDYLYGDGMDFIGGNGSSHIYILGNYFHDIGTDTHHGPPATTDFRSYAIYFNGYGTTDYVYLGHNEVDYTAYGRGVQFFGHHEADWIDHLYVFNNWIHDTTMQGIVFSGEGGETDYAFCKNVYVYNNIISTAGTNNQAQFAGQYGNGKYGGYFYVINNIFDGSRLTDYPNILVGEEIDYMEFRNNILIGVPNSYGYYTYFPGSAPNTSKIDADHNLYYGGGSGKVPVWDDSTLGNNDPLFIDSTPINYDDYLIQASSPAINQGSAVALASKDFFGIPRGAIYDIGVYEYFSQDAVSPDAPQGLSVI